MIVKCPSLLSELSFAHRHFLILNALLSIKVPPNVTEIGGLVSHSRSTFIDNRELGMNAKD